MECKRVDHLLDAYLDAELDPLHALEVEAHLKDCRNCTAALAQQQTLRDALRTHMPSYAAPDSLRRKLTFAAQPARRFSFRGLAMAACLAIAVGAGAWILATRLAGAASDSSAVLAAAVEGDHLRSLLPTDHLTDVLSSDQHTVKPWFIGKLSYTPPVDPLTDTGFPLVGGRLDVLDGHPVAALVYRRRLHIINLFVWPSAEGPAAPEFRTTPRGYHIAHWTASGMTYWAISDAGADELRTFAALLSASPAASAPAATNP